MKKFFKKFTANSSFFQFFSLQLSGFLLFSAITLAFSPALPFKPAPSFTNSSFFDWNRDGDCAMYSHNGRFIKIEAKSLCYSYSYWYYNMNNLDECCTYSRDGVEIDVVATKFCE